MIHVWINSATHALSRDLDKLLARYAWVAEGQRLAGRMQQRHEHLLATTLSLNADLLV